MREKNEYKFLEEAYTQVNEARFWGAKEEVARHNKERRKAGYRYFRNDETGRGTSGPSSHFTDEKVEELERTGYTEREIEDIGEIEDAEVAVTAEDGLAAMDLFYKVLKGQSEAFAEMTDEQEAKYENLEALIRDELMYPL